MVTVLCIWMLNWCIISREEQRLMEFAKRDIEIIFEVNVE